MTDVWELDDDSPDWLETLATRLLEVGVPPTAISKAFAVDIEAVRTLQSTLRITPYGTAEITEAMNFLMWRAYHDALDILDSAPSTSRQRFITTLLSRQSLILGKESPEGLNKMRAELQELVGTINVPDTLQPSIYSHSQFTPPTVDGEADDPEERPDG